MTPTVLLYLGMVLVLGATSVVLLLRDLRARDAATATVVGGVQRLPEPIPEGVPLHLTDRLDRNFRQLVFQSGIDLAAEPAFLMCVLVGLLIGGGMMVWYNNPPMAVGGFILGMVAPLTIYLIARRRRLRSIREQLPDVMDLMSRSVRAGETLDQAIDNVGQSAGEPLGVEFARAARQLEMGLPLDTALRALTRRAPITEMRILSAALNVQRRSGGNLGVTLDRLAGVIRDRLSYQRQFMAATGASRMATILIALAGPLVFAYMLMAQPDYMGQFFVLPGGWTLLSISVVLQLVGLTWVIGLLRNDY